MAGAHPMHLRSLTGLRFFAALLVVLYHLSRYFTPLNRMSVVVGFGYTGVGFFFVLSGFVLTWSSREGQTARGFYWRRFARVWPLHALTTGFAVIVAAMASASVLWAALPFVLTLTQSWVPSADYRYAFNGVSWSLACEAFFYLLFPVLLRLLQKRRNLFVPIALIAVTALGIGFVLAKLGRLEDDYLLYTMPPVRLGEFVIGICLALLIKRGWRPRFSMGAAVASGLIGYTLLMVYGYAFRGGTVSVSLFIADVWMLPAFAAIIAAGAAGDLAGAKGLIRSRALVKLGQWSFALYLIHELVLKATSHFGSSLSILPAVALSVFAVAFSVALSGALYECYERPIESRLRSWATTSESIVTQEVP